MTKVFRVYVTTTARDSEKHPFATSNFRRVVRFAELSQNREFEVTSYPDRADCIVFIDPQRRYASDIVHSSLFRSFWKKSVVVDFSDRPYPALSGLYAGATAAWQFPHAVRPMAYLRVADNKSIDIARQENMYPDLLFSFQGKVENCESVRSGLMRLKHARSIVIDSGTKQSDGHPDYVRLMCRSKFVLAPRGFGPSSWRLYETMRAGRVPVILSDNWVAPRGVNWSDFSLRVREADIPGIPSLLEGLEKDSERMGNAARQAWISNFSQSTMFGWLAAQCADIVAHGVTYPKNRFSFAWGERNVPRFLKDEVKCWGLAV